MPNNATESEKVFVINDVSLKIAPTMIQLNEQDLTYSWKTLRTKSTAKMSSGHTKKVIHVQIPFKSEMMLDLHRLLVEFRHSPFMFVENRYLREILCPEWGANNNQKMAFTLRNANVQPAAGLTDVWILDLQLSWFNYFPYANNWLYREDWCTNWVFNQREGEVGPGYKYSIGWTYDENGKKINRPSLIDYDADAQSDELLLPWGVVQKDYERLDKKTIIDMERMHQGEVFDLLPLPSNMSPAKFVNKPSDSRIYVRYINLLQRDALKRNFNIDCEADIVAQGGLDGFDYFFAAKRNPEYKLTTLSLHEGGELPWYAGLKSSWISKMLYESDGDSYSEGFSETYTEGSMFEFERSIRTRRPKVSSGVRFSFEKYASVRYPDSWVENQYVQKKIMLSTIELGAMKDMLAPRYSRSDRSVENAALIAQMLKDNGATGVMVVAAVVNAAYESGLNHEATNQSPYTSDPPQDSDSNRSSEGRRIEGHHAYNVGYPGDPKRNDIDYDPNWAVSAGLFQINDSDKPEAWGSRAGTVAQRQDPVFNINKIQEDPGWELFELVANKSGDYKVAIAAFTQFVERPKGTTKAAIYLELKGSSTGEKIASLTSMIDNNNLELSMFGEYAQKRANNSHNVFPNIEEYISGKYNSSPSSTSAPSGLSSTNAPPNTQGMTPDEAAAALAEKKRKEKAYRQINDFVQQMHIDGWRYYTESSYVTNVWHKYEDVTLTISNDEYSNGAEFSKNLFSQHEAVVTHVSAGLRHVVADVPIIGQTTPTHQFLGSVQPYYEMEITYKDGDSPLDLGNRTGLPLQAREINSMKNILQNSARNFRQIPDSWCLSVDCFITRLFGSYEYEDLSLLESNMARESGGVQRLLDWEMTKRMAFTGSSHATLPGHPGVSTVKLTMEETSPYIEGETLTPTSVAPEGLDASRSEVLNAVYNWGLDKYDPTLTALYLAQHAGSTDDEILDLGSMTNTTRPDEEDFGKFVIDDILYHKRDSLTVSPNNGAAQRVSEYRLFIPNDDSIASALNALGANMGEPARQDAGPTLLLPQNYLADLAVRESGYGNKDGYTQVRLEDDQRYLDFSQSSVTSGGHVSGDISQLLEENPDLGDIPIKKLLDHRFGIRSLVKNISLMIAEDQSVSYGSEGENLYFALDQDAYGEIKGNPLPKEAVRQALYDLPIEPSMWRSFACYTETYALISSRVENNSDYFRTLEEGNMSPPPFSELENTLSREFKRFAEDAAYSEYNSNVNSFTGAATAITTNVANSFDRLFNASFSAISSTTSISDHENTVYADVLEDLASSYISNMPAMIESNEFLKFYGYEQFLQGLFSGKGPDGNLQSQTQYFAESLQSTNFWGWDVNQSHAVYRGLNNWQRNGIEGIELDDDGYFAGASGVFQAWTELVLTPFNVVDSFFPYSLPGTEQFGGATFGELLVNVPTALPKLLGGAVDVAGDSIFGPSGPSSTPAPKALFRVSASHEAEKVKYFKSALTNMADALLQDVALLEYLGLGHLVGALTEVQPRGDQAYPDMEIPHHPYYGDVYSVSPDFYMWNIYEDGGVGAADIKGEIAASIDVIVDRSYSASRRLSSGGTTNTSRKVYEEDSLARPNVKIGSEGSEGVDIPFARPSDKPEAVVEFEKRWNSEMEVDISPNQPLHQIGSGSDATVANTVYPDSQAGAFGNPTPTTVIPRLSAEESTLLEAKMKTLLEEKSEMFGSRAGFLESKNPLVTRNSQVEEASKDTQFERPTASHLFDKASLRKLADGAANTMLTHKYRVARAYPTYKLFFVEEDELTDRFINYDDFYSYAAVKDFYYEEDKMSPVQTAIITLQNISGILDGTKRNAVADIDHLGKSNKALKQSEINLASSGVKSLEMIREDANDSNYESQDGIQSFGALSLRTGLNVQLRAGYSNDPSDLHVLLSGRVVAVQWNKQGDLAEITVQSFGAELVQEMKGWQEDGGSVSYPTTHHLLASMIMEPEVVHFGRWEIGQLFQPGEMKDTSFDFTDYSNEGSLGHLTALNFATKWMANNPGLMAIGILTATAFSLTPAGGSIGRVLGRAPLGIGKLSTFLAKSMGTIPGRMGVNSFKRVLPKQALSRPVSAIEGTNGKTLIGQAFASASDKIRERLTRAGLDKKLIDEVFNVGKVTAFKVDDAGEFILVNGAKVVKTGSEYAAEAAALNAKIATRAARALWLGRAEPVFAGVADGGVRALFSSTTAWGAAKGTWSFVWNGGGRLLSGYTGTFGRVGVAALAVDGALLLGSSALDKVLPEYILNAKSYFNATQSRLMLSPQDDNIYAPHPKDYINMDVSPLVEAISGAAVSLGRSFGFDGVSVLGLVNGMFNQLTNKKVEPESVLYTPNGSTIWDIFYEMTYRHPGWVAYNRPYGRRFRYTMFFGVPSQRYWSKPADDRFVMRMTELHDYLKNDEISETEYLKLYGDPKLLDEIKTEAEAQITAAARRNLQLTQGTTTSTTYQLPAPSPGGGFTTSTSTPTPNLVNFDPGMDITQTDQYKNYVKTFMTSTALKEYMRGLDLRFVPFRRYHFISSDTDIVSNGIIVDENSTFNAVHMRYKDTDSSDSASGEVKTSSFKIHSSLPPYSTRYAEADVNPNVKGFRMAQRYAVGIMADNISKMYRGEIVVVGNPQIRVHDVVILSDTINDIHGPVVVEKVTHVMSHEYGFITSIKPAAFVIANELSSWPLLEAMKMYGMAMKDIHQQGTKEDVVSTSDIKKKTNANESGLAAFYEGNKSAMDFMAEFGDENSDNYYRSKYESIFDGAADADVYGGEIPDSPFLDGALQDAAWYSAFAGGAGLTGGAIATMGGALDGLRWLNGSESLAFKSAASMAGGKSRALVGLGGVSAVAGLAATAAIEAPSGAALIGSYVLMAQCLHQEAVQIVPLLKNGNPMVGGLSNRDPILVWKSFAGDMRNLADDMINGTSDAVDLFKRYGDSLWRDLPTAIQEAKNSKVNLGM